MAGEFLCEKDAKRFDVKVSVDDSTGCHLWTAYRDVWGYGRFIVAGVVYRAHRLSFARANGFSPDGMVVRHKCDNPACVNPDHLELGTVVDNVNDKVARNRCAIKIPGASIIAIRERNGTCQSVATEFGVSAAAVCLIRNGKRRKSAGGTA